LVYNYTNGLVLISIRQVRVHIKKCPLFLFVAAENETVQRGEIKLSNFIFPIVSNSPHQNLKKN
jgi:hypothetical protein